MATKLRFSILITGSGIMLCVDIGWRRSYISNSLLLRFQIYIYHFKLNCESKEPGLKLLETTISELQQFHPSYFAFVFSVSSIWYSISYLINVSSVMDSLYVTEIVSLVIKHLHCIFKSSWNLTRCSVYWFVVLIRS